MCDAERLVTIADRVLAGEPIEDFDLGEYEIFVVTGYCQRAMGLVAASSPGQETRL